jgi:hypothetical protein
MRPSVYKHNGESYIILDQVPTHHFAKTFQDNPNLDYVNLYMKWRGAVLNQNKMNKEKLVGMICKEWFETLEENHPFFGIKKVLTPYLN